jgi:type III restriction enzyme
LVAKLIDFDEIDYDAHAELLYGLAAQVVAHLRGYLKDDDEVRLTLQGWSRDLAKAVFAQMRQHMWRTTTTYRVTLNAAFSELKPQAFDGSGKDAVRDFRQPPERLSEIKRFIFTGFGPRACYAQAKFDSDTERKMALLLERDPTVELWMKPGPDQFKIFDSEGHSYQPDFVVETKSERLIVETKRRAEMNSPEVRRKANAAALWCWIASEHHSKPYQDKSWRYVLVPDDEVRQNTTIDGLIAAHTYRPTQSTFEAYNLAVQCVSASTMAGPSRRFRERALAFISQLASWGHRPFSIMSSFRSDEWLPVDTTKFGPSELVAG